MTPESLRKEALERFPFRYQEMYKEFHENDYFGSAVKTEEDKKRVLCRQYRLRLVPSFVGSDLCPTEEELLAVLTNEE